jgi:hypothetical protein
LSAYQPYEITLFEITNASLVTNVSSDLAENFDQVAVGDLILGVHYDVDLAVAGSWSLFQQHFDDASSAYKDVLGSRDTPNNPWLDNQGQSAAYVMPAHTTISQANPLIVFPRTRFLQNFNVSPGSGDNVVMKLVLAKHFS